LFQLQQVVDMFFRPAMHNVHSICKKSNQANICESLKLSLDVHAENLHYLQVLYFFGKMLEFKFCLEHMVNQIGGMYAVIF
jgi:hypothetical protein